ncbi:hypothetical protein Tcan_17104 [Toxocara canis]|uniref:Uncharacterized protein n=1 Tax=Toxocara canis TaxID=6265 RepID=A0A0B2VA56_TOXCA|nr:hypothetical protein Tcan_17104 [Toxocara canis]
MSTRKQRFKSSCFSGCKDPGFKGFDSEEFVCLSIFMAYYPNHDRYGHALILILFQRPVSPLTSDFLCLLICSSVHLPTLFSDVLTTLYRHHCFSLRFSWFVCELCQRNETNSCAKQKKTAFVSSN